MTTTMLNKVETLRALIGDGVTYDRLVDLTFRNDAVPSITSLRKYGLLKVVRTETYTYEMTEEEWECEEWAEDDDVEDWEWNEEKGAYVWTQTVNYYGV